MEADKQSKSDGNFLQEIDNDSQIDMLSLSTEENSSNTITTEELMISKIYEKLGSLSVEVETLLLEKNNTLVARLETMEQKLKVAELEAKLAKQEVHNLVAEKMTELAGQIREELNKIISEQVAKMIEVKMSEVTAKLEQKHCKFMEKMQQMRSKMEDENAKLKKELNNMRQENQQKFSGQKANEGESNKSKFAWSTNRWDNSGLQVSANGLVAINASGKDGWTNLCAQQPISRQILTSLFGRKLVYYEVLLKDLHWFGNFFVGWAGHDFPLNSTEPWIGHHPGSYGIDWHGNYYGSGRKPKKGRANTFNEDNENCWHPGCEIARFASYFNSGDVIGSGLLLTREGQLKIFFTKNGQMNGKPMPLDNNKQQNPLYPVVSFHHNLAALVVKASMEANFGADLGKKPFKFNIEANEAQLFV